MTLDDIKAMTDDWITPATAAKVMRMDPGKVIAYARTNQLPFACRISGNRVLISRKSFLAAYCPEEPEEESPDSLELIAAELHTMTLLLTTIAMKIDPRFEEFLSREKGVSQ